MMRGHEGCSLAEDVTRKNRLDDETHKGRSEEQSKRVLRRRKQVEGLAGVSHQKQHLEAADSDHHWVLIGTKSQGDVTILSGRVPSKLL